MLKCELHDKLLLMLALLVASAYMYSNAGKDVIPVGNILTIVSIILSIFIVRPIDLLVILVISSLIFLSSLTAAIKLDYWFNFTYKILSFLPVVLLIRSASISIIFKASLFSFMSSTLIALILLGLGLQDDRFIIYQDFIPRFAGLAIEPSTYSIACLSIFILHLLKRRVMPIWITFVYYVPIIFAVSGVVLLKILNDVFIKFKPKFFLISIIFLLPLFFILYFETRAGHAIETRIMLYEDILASEKIIFFGNGFYMHEGAKGLPGFFRIYFELGPIFLLAMIIFYILIVIQKKLFRWPFLFIGMVLPFIQEAYGAPFLWLVSGFCLLRSRHMLVRQ